MNFILSKTKKCNQPLAENRFRRLSVLAIAVALLFCAAPAWGTPLPGVMETHVRALSAWPDRSTGTEGSRKAAQYILAMFRQLDLDSPGVHRFSTPVLVHRGSSLTLQNGRRTVPIDPMPANIVSPQTIAKAGLEGPLIYVERGALHAFNGKSVQGAIVLMEMDSGGNWLHAANLGAAAVIYIDRGPTAHVFFREKKELLPVQFPRFWMPESKARALFGNFEHLPSPPTVRLQSDIRWEQTVAENVYGVIPGNDPLLKNEVVVIEAFYDSTAHVLGRSPGADEAAGIASLLTLAQELKADPPGRTVVLVASAGHAQTLAGMRELIWSLRTRSRDLRKSRKRLKNTADRASEMLDVLRSGARKFPESPAEQKRFLAALENRTKTEVDVISRQLMQLRLRPEDTVGREAVQRLAKQRMMLRSLGWRTDLQHLSSEEKQALLALVSPAIEDYTAEFEAVRAQENALRSAGRFRNVVMEREPVAFVSLYLSSHGDGLGAYNTGWMYPLKPTINRVGAYRLVDEALRAGGEGFAAAGGDPELFHDTLRPSRKQPWESYFFDQPPLGGEVSAMAGYHGISLVTGRDARAFWGTPYDLPDAVDFVYLEKQQSLVSHLIRSLCRAEALHEGKYPRNGFSTVTGRANFLRHGELFADQPAPGSLVQSFQGPTIYYAMVDPTGHFTIKGLADKKHVLYKLIIEGYRFDPDTGAVVWAIDKKQTGKDAYRLKITRRSMETDLVMFACRQSTLFNQLEPRNFNYMTKIQLLDARREATPLRYWWSRIDTRVSNINSIFMDPGSRMKMTLSDTVLRKKMILTKATPQRPEGVGYPVDEMPKLLATEYHVAKDMWALLGPRIRTMEDRGIYDERLRALEQAGVGALAAADTARQEQRYDRFSALSLRAWALASRVYDQVETTQKDILMGVLFYIALFVPFAFCMERLLFSYRNIHKRIVAFLGILLLLIFVIYHVHPAFELAYSPTVVILAFFIMGLSLIVTLIIFFRFETEMIQLQRRAHRLKSGELNRWKAFAAAFFLGVSNLRRRRLRTLLTCTTLVILTFTIMSFTSVKTIRHHARILYRDHAPYQGYLIKNFNWRDLPPAAVEILGNEFEQAAAAAPRVWFEADDKTRAAQISLRRGELQFEARGAVGLSVQEALSTDLKAIVTAGRWFREGERRALMLPDRIAARLDIDPRDPKRSRVWLWGTPFQVVGTFSGKALQEWSDLDGEPMTPVTFPEEISLEMTEVEMEALESGEDVQGFQSRYQHVPADLTLILPFRTLLASGGHLKSVAVLPKQGAGMPDVARKLVDRFGLSLFSGEADGTYLYHASDTLNYSGVPNIFIPLLISVLIVLNTMIGSVYERKREIGIYTSVGLAPSHVGFLFVAEALAFAVISVVLGYLVAQTTASMFSGSDLWAGITVNYSSLAGVAAMVLVIGVVLVSVIYPSKVAARIAIPDVNRSWVMPNPKENTLEIQLPFLLKFSEQKSVGGYLYDHFISHRDVSHGVFSTGNVQSRFVDTPVAGDAAGLACIPMVPGMGSDAVRCLYMEATVWLTPFDFGIMQRVELEFCPSGEEPGFLEIRMRIFRMAGEANAWGRLNKAFVNDIRKQLLMWRSFDPESFQHFEDQLVVETTCK